MKKLEFTTSKGSFILVDLSEVETANYLVHTNVDSIICNVKNMTEEHFSDIVDSFELFGNINVGYKNYAEEEPVLDTSKESFESLVKYLGWYLFENQYSNFADEMVCQEAESKTLYNPILLKKI